jgi:hypothetical protein
MKFTRVEFTDKNLNAEALGEINRVFGSIENLTSAFNSLYTEENRGIFVELINNNEKVAELLEGVQVAMIEEGMIHRHEQFRELKWEFPFPIVILNSHDKPVMVFVYEQILMADIRDFGEFECLYNLVAHEMAHYNDMMSGDLQYLGSEIVYMGEVFSHAEYISLLADFFNDPYNPAKAKLFLEQNPWERKAYMSQMENTFYHTPFTDCIREALKK